MLNTARKISKSQGQTLTEAFLSSLCDNTFLKLWSYANPFKADGKELCDLIAVFENHVFLFFDRESRTLDTSTKDISITWDRWLRTAVLRQISTADGAHRYVLRSPQEIYLDTECTIPLPIKIPAQDVIIHKIVVAHGANAACLRFSPENISGSLGITYSDDVTSVPWPFVVHLRRIDPVHVLDSHNLEIILRELDTFHDFTSYLRAKEAAIQQFDYIAYCGEEDLLANYFRNFDPKSKTHFIGTRKKHINGIMIEEGFWVSFTKTEVYKRKKGLFAVSCG